MAVEARHLNIFPPQLISNREMMNSIETNMNLNLYNAQLGYSSLLPLSGTTTTAAAGVGTEAMLPPAMYSSIAADSLPQQQKTPIKSESTLTYNNIPLLRKRSRDTSGSINYTFPSSYPATASTVTVQPHHKNCGSFTFLGEDITLQIHQQQLDIDQLVAQRMEKVRMELEEKRKRHARRIMEAIEVSVMKRLKAKEDEIEKMGKLNWALEEKVKSLCIENQIWRDLAQTNEATANALRTNLEQVLAQRGCGGAVEDDGATVCPGGAATAAVMDDAESCCGSSDDCGDKNLEEKVVESCGGGWRTLAGVNAQDKGGRLCKNCGKGESCVLILPCRHLCLCTVCGSSLHTCPICKSVKTASVHVNMS
ncbi:hypothetical protein HN51_025619 [Arachis hypogaea]|uniref:RING-type E3 ubiquitin transferase n=1 Tax=Arachis hypogaea TaxID=3818 RepID=A0A445CEI0_ARAHY|nr:probable BOI-related E3 ubiquitin-protein ligase 3 [Arachis hypogaea]QHO28104.1 putative BOI-related E3 ubiquitin-protein ligase [Arachis hypogaea]RYR49340.1 hypothetical protein Ahy_A07g035806 [Arachis hypogaea]